jgi:glycosyltransferase involved in cell wall biosynthesis
LKAFVFFHYFHPDDETASILFSELAAGLAERGWDVTAFTCNRGCRQESREYPSRDLWRGVKIVRTWRPPLRQASIIGRLLNAGWMIVRWALLAFRRANNPDLLIVGTDPIFSVAIAPIWRTLKPRTKIVHWCFDLYPEAACADGLLSWNGFLTKRLRTLANRSYAACDVLVDLGPCMREALSAYSATPKRLTVPPWALEEPPAVLPTPLEERKSIFGRARLGLLYSGNFGRAHSCADILELARLMRAEDACVAFGVRGNRVEALRQAVRSDDDNVRFLPFAPLEQMGKRLASADILIVSLREELIGAVVPSKFFGALAIGRPVLFCGGPGSSVAQWIRQFNLGWVLPPGCAAEVVHEIRAFAANPQEMEAMRQRCHRVYREHFSKQAALNNWHASLSGMFQGSFDVQRDEEKTIVRTD